MTVLFAKTSPEGQSIYIYIHRLSRDQSTFTHNSLRREFRELSSEKVLRASARRVLSVPTLKSQPGEPPRPSTPYVLRRRLGEGKDHRGPAWGGFCS